MIRFKPIRSAYLIALMMELFVYAVLGLQVTSQIRYCSRRIVLGPMALVAREVALDLDDVPSLSLTHQMTNFSTSIVEVDQFFSLSRRYTWNERVAQLQEYVIEFRHANVPKRYSGHGNLGLWIAKQRRYYKQHVRGDKSPLTETKISILSELGFCWDASTINRHTNRKVIRRVEPDDDWWANYHDLKAQLEVTEKGRVALLSLSSPTRQWLDQQRKVLGQTNAETMDDLASRRIVALSQLDPLWSMSRRDLQWELRFQELLDYRKRHDGDLNVPISCENKQLGHWVSNMRKQYNLLQRNKPSLLTSQRLKRLEAIGFVWNRWDDAFTRKEVFRTTSNGTIVHKLN